MKNKFDTNKARAFNLALGALAVGLMTGLFADQLMQGSTVGPIIVTLAILALNARNVVYNYKKIENKTDDAQSV